MRLILIRHGETYANVLYNTKDRILMGALDNELTLLNETGKKQAYEAKQKLIGIHIDEIFCSDLTRTKQTASILFEDREINYTALLRERSLGSDQGKRADEVFADPRAWKYHVNIEEDSLHDCLNKKVPDGENYLDVFERCKKFLSQFNYEEEKTIAIVAHFHVLRCMIYILLDKEINKDIYQLMIPNSKPIFYLYKEGQFHEE